VAVPAIEPEETNVVFVTERHRLDPGDTDSRLVRALAVKPRGYTDDGRN
jgi:hypothetical protein